MWSIADIADSLEAGLRADAAALDAEHAVYGLDARDELALHPLVASWLNHAGFGVHREQRYPADRPRTSRISEGERCDFVLTPGRSGRPAPGKTAGPHSDPDSGPHAGPDSVPNSGRDPGGGGRPLQQEAARSTLFDPPDAVPLDEAFWLEAKIVAQHTIDGPNRTYASQLLSPVRKDASKLSKDKGILHAGILLLLFTEDRTIAEHDLAAWLERCLDRGVPVGSPALRHVPITDRIGNGNAAIAVYPVSHL